MTWAEAFYEISRLAIGSLCGAFLIGIILLIALFIYTEFF